MKAKCPTPGCENPASCEFLITGPQPCFSCKPPDAEPITGCLKTCAGSYCGRGNPDPERLTAETVSGRLGINTPPIQWLKKPKNHPEPPIVRWLPGGAIKVSYDVALWSRCSAWSDLQERFSLSFVGQRNPWTKAHTQSFWAYECFDLSWTKSSGYMGLLKEVSQEEREEAVALWKKWKEKWPELAKRYSQTEPE